MSEDGIPRGRQMFAQLCSTCQNIFGEPHTEDWFDTWHLIYADRSALDASAKSGCDVCARVALHAIDRPLGAASTRDRNSTDADLWGICVRAQLSLSNEIRFQMAWGGGLVMQTFFDQALVIERSHKEEDVDEGEQSDEEEATIASNMTQAELTDSTLSNHTWRLARKWLHKCRTDHERCNSIVNARFSPRRLVQVNMIGGSLSLRLHQHSQIPENTQYCTLSHCWGIQKILTLTLQNKTKLQHEIPWNEMPTVFRDAALAAFELGLRYIWIDSLCIIQNSKADWIQESSEMGKIYKNATLNIAGTGFSEGQSGLFAKRDPRELFPLRLNVKWSGMWAGLDQARAGEHFLLDDETFRDEVEQAPLNRRGWVVQERLLSPRILHFGSKQIFWECFDETFSEVFPEGGPMDINMFSMFKYSLNDLPLSSTPASLLKVTAASNSPNPASKELRAKAYKAWSQIVETYSLGALTRAEDKLPAISGVAKTIQSFLGDVYLAGIWKGNLRRELLWSLSSLKKAKIAFPLQYRAPTWSWASIDGTIACLDRDDYNDEEDEEGHIEVFYCTIIDAVVKPSTTDPTGPVSGGYIRMKGPFFLAKQVDQHWIVNKTIVEMQVYLDYMAPTIEDEELSKVALGLPRADTANILVSHAYDIKIKQACQFFLFTVLSDWSESDGHAYTTGLVLIPHGNLRGRYTRIGMFKCIGESQGVLQRNGEAMPEQRYEIFDGDGRHTILIF